MNLNVKINQNTMSTIISVVSVTASLITAVVAQWHSRKMRKIDIEESHYQDNIAFKRNLYMNYLKCTGTYLSKRDPNDKHLYQESYYQLLGYAPQDICSILIEINDDIDKKGSQCTVTKQKLPEVASLIKKELQSLD